MNLLETNNICIKFGGLKAVNQVNFIAKKDEITAIIGPNGAGKTTLFNLMAGYYAPTSGTVAFKGENITSLKAYERTKLGIARTFQNINLFKELSVLENAMVGQHCRTHTNLLQAMFNSPFKKKEERRTTEYVMEILDFVGLADVAKERASSLSYGMQKNLEIARALASDPGILLLDEPASGLNTHELSEVVNRIRRIQERGVTVVLIEHKMDVVMSISNQIFVLNFGELIAHGTPDEVRRNSDVIEAYLGKEEEEYA